MADYALFEGRNGNHYLVRRQSSEEYRRERIPQLEQQFGMSSADFLAQYDPQHPDFHEDHLEWWVLLQSAHIDQTS